MQITGQLGKGTALIITLYISEASDKIKHTL